MWFAMVWFVSVARWINDFLYNLWFWSDGFMSYSDGFQGVYSMVFLPKHANKINKTGNNKIGNDKPHSKSNNNVNRIYL